MWVALRFFARIAPMLSEKQDPEIMYNFHGFSKNLWGRGASGKYRWGQQGAVRECACPVPAAVVWFPAQSRPRGCLGLGLWS